MSIDHRGKGLRQDAAGRIGRPGFDRSSGMLEAPDAAQIARTLTEKYGIDALAFARDRAQRALDIGDEVALEAWHSVIAATQSLLARIASG